MSNLRVYVFQQFVKKAANTPPNERGSFRSQFWVKLMVAAEMKIRQMDYFDLTCQA